MAMKQCPFVTISWNPNTQINVNVNSYCRSLKVRNWVGLSANFCTMVPGNPQRTMLRPYAYQSNATIQTKKKKKWAPLSENLWSIDVWRPILSNKLQFLFMQKSLLNGMPATKMYTLGLSWGVTKLQLNREIATGKVFKLDVHKTANRTPKAMKAPNPQWFG